MKEIDHVLADKRLLGAGLGPLATWRTWLIALKAAFGRPLDVKERKVFRAIAGKRGLPKHRVRELWCVAGRRSGKSRMAAAIAIFLGLFQKHRLSPGERGVVLVLAASVDQARVVFNYVKGFLEASPALAREIVAVKQFEIELRAASLSASTQTPTAPSAAAPWLPPSLTKRPFGVTRAPRRPTLKLTPRCCRRWPLRMAC